MWMQNPHSGGRKVPDGLQAKITGRIIAHAEANYAGNSIKIDTKFKGKFCYIDAYKEPFVPEDRYDEVLFGKSREERIKELRETPIHLCRLRHFSVDRWSMAFFAHSSMKYEPSLFDTGNWFGTVEEGLDSSAMYLTDPADEFFG